jgi:hypothetical protein
MKKTGLLAAIALLSAVCVVAQQAPTSQSSQPQATSSDNQAVIEGCLASASGGGFALTDQTGASRLLAGATSDLSSHIGHQVRLTGKEATPPSTPTSDNPSQSKGAFNVSKVEMISDTCSTKK